MDGNSSTGGGALLCIEASADQKVSTKKLMS